MRGEVPPARLTRAAYRDICDHGAQTYPNECCGALLGDARTGTIDHVLRLPNTTSEGPRRRFLIQPRDYLSAERHAAAHGADLLGFYHSHPDHPARPSAHDLEQAWPHLQYLILSVREGHPEELTAWRLADDRSAFLEEAFTVGS
jgi:proteasome lid subunit RPN8/RPN11